MTDEEKKAIEFIKSELQDEKKKTRDDYQSLTGLYGNLEIEIILNLIEKQSKEIEELKGKNNGLEIKANELYNLADVVKRDYIHKDKIKAKIEEFKIIRDTIIKNKKYFNSPMMTYDLKRNDYCEKMLQSLLEKE